LDRGPNMMEKVDAKQFLQYKERIEKAIENIQEFDVKEAVKKQGS